MGLDFDFLFEAPDTVSRLLTLCGLRRAIMTTAALILILVCARETGWGFILGVLLEAVTLVLTLPYIFYMVLSKPPGFEPQLFGPIVWSIIQLPIVFFGLRALKK